MELYGTIMELFMVGKFGQPWSEAIRDELSLLLTVIKTR